MLGIVLVLCPTQQNCRLLELLILQVRRRLISIANSVSGSENGGNPPSQSLVTMVPLSRAQQAQEIASMVQNSTVELLSLCL